MTAYKKFTKQIFKYCIIIAVIIELIGIIVLGFESKFLFGILAGTGTTILNFAILEASAIKLMQKHSQGPVVAGYFIRLPIYGVVFYFCLKAGIPCAAACALGFLTLPLSMLYVYGIRSRFPGAEKNPLNDWTQPKKWRDLSEFDDEDDDWGPLPKWTKKDKK
jgi:hypothetical protein